MIIPVNTYYVFGSGNSYVSGVPKSIADKPRIDLGHNGFWGLEGAEVAPEEIAGLTITGYAYPGGSRTLVDNGTPTHAKFIVNW